MGGWVENDSLCGVGAMYYRMELWMAQSERRGYIACVFPVHPFPYSIVLPLPLAAQTLPPLATRVSSAAGEDTTTALRGVREAGRERRYFRMCGEGDDWVVRLARSSDGRMGCTHGTM